MSLHEYIYIYIKGDIYIYIHLHDSGVFDGDECDHGLESLWSSEGRNRGHPCEVVSL